jgi:hypothetical protein
MWDYCNRIAVLDVGISDERFEAFLEDGKDMKQSGGGNLENPLDTIDYTTC